MRICLNIAAGGLLVGVVGGCSMLDTGNVYAKPLDVAYAELAATPIPPMIASAFPGSSPRIVRRPASIEWHFGHEAHDRATFTAFLSSEDVGHTRVAVDVQVDKGKDTIDGPYFTSPLMLNILREAMAEQVSAELEDRSFDKLRYGNRLSAYMTTHPEDVKAYGETVRKTMNDVATQVNGYPKNLPKDPAALLRSLDTSGDIARAINEENAKATVAGYAHPNANPVPGATAPTTDLSKYN